jgi:hypothetical protein
LLFQYEFTDIGYTGVVLDEELVPGKDGIDALDEGVLLE